MTEMKIPPHEISKAQPFYRVAECRICHKGMTTHPTRYISETKNGTMTDVPGKGRPRAVGSECIKLIPFRYRWINHDGQFVPLWTLKVKT